MLKTFWVARREFIATVATKGFIFGVVFPPLMMGFVLFLMPILMRQASPRVTGHVAVIDQSGVVAAKLVKRLNPDEMAERRREQRERAIKRTAGKLPMNPGTEAMAGALASQDVGPQLTVRTLEVGADVDEAKKPIMEAQGKEQGGRANGENGAPGDPRLALIVIPAASVRQDESRSKEDGPFAPFMLFVAAKLDVEVKGDIEQQVREAIVDARIEAGGMPLTTVRELIKRPESETKSVTRDGERNVSEVAQVMIPVGFMFLLWISVFTAGQYLLTSTVEEKSTRVMEVLLSAVSPMQLMVGKITGQMAVGITMLLAYSSLGMGGLYYAQQNQLVDPLILVYLAIYFVIAFFLVASMMAAVGSAVNDMREAQALMGPVMIVLIIPMMLWFPISRNPNSMFAQVVSFIPPISPFVMVLRLGGSEPIPVWQIPATIAAGLVSVVIAAWGAAKIFRIGVLMYGKPPNMRTLWRWVRMA